MFKTSCCGLLAAIMFSALLALGCARGPGQQPTDKAEAVLGKVLDSWTRGESPDKFAAADQPIQASDPEWQEGFRLLSFLSVDALQLQDSPQNFRCRVSLSLEDPMGTKIDKVVTYNVQLGDKSVIRRVSSTDIRSQ